MLYHFQNMTQNDVCMDIEKRGDGRPKEKVRCKWCRDGRVRTGERMKKGRIGVEQKNEMFSRISKANQRIRSICS